VAASGGRALPRAHLAGQLGEAGQIHRRELEEALRVEEALGPGQAAALGAAHVLEQRLERAAEGQHVGIADQEPVAARALGGQVHAHGVAAVLARAHERDIGLALERGEVQAACALALSTAKSTFEGNVKRGELKYFVQFGKTQDVSYFGGAPNFYKMIKTEEQIQIADLFFLQSEIARPLIGPPGLQPAFVAALRKAMADTMTDRAFLAEAEKSGLDIDFVSGEETAQSFADFYKTPPEVVAKAREIMGRK
jgi:hypothetical protein